MPPPSPEQLSTLAFFMTFTATFAPAALMPVIREDLNLTKQEVGNSGECSVLCSPSALCCPASPRQPNPQPMSPELLLLILSFPPSLPSVSQVCALSSVPLLAVSVWAPSWTSLALASELQSSC